MEKPAPANESPDRAYARVSLGRVLRAIGIGALIFVLLQFSPWLMLKLQGVDLSPQQTLDAEAEPEYHDQQGRRINSADYKLLQGRTQAEQSDITSHAQCRSFTALERLGCDRYVTEHKNFPPHVHQGDFDSGKTSQQCEDEVNAHWSARVADEREMGNNVAADSWTRRQWLPELHECGNYDNLRIAKVIYEPAARLEQLLSSMEGGYKVTAEERTAVLKDMTVASTFPDNTYKTAYLERIDYFWQLADGNVEPRRTYVKLSCEAFQTQINELRKADQESAITQQRLNRRVAAENAQWEALNKANIDRLWDWQLYADGAKDAGCQVNAEGRPRMSYKKNAAPPIGVEGS